MSLEENSGEKVISNTNTAAIPNGQENVQPIIFTCDSAAAAGVMYIADNKVLLVKRASDKNNGNLWAFPAGRIEAGETDMQAAIREFEEETGHKLAEVFNHSYSNDFSLFRVRGEIFNPILNEEHTEFQWAPLDSLPSPLHDGVAIAVASLKVAMDSSRITDTNGWIEVKDNPLSKVGVFPYSGKSVGGDPNKVYRVYRPAEELQNQECIDSFKLLPWINDHVMLGGGNGLTPAEKKGIEGVIGENVYFKNDVLYGNIKILSENLAKLIESGKKQLSAGYRCTYDMVSGVWNGVAYDAIQRNIRGNHLALVQEGRMGKEVAVLDHLTFTFDTKEIDMPISDEEKQRMNKVCDWVERRIAQDELEAEEKAKKEAADAEEEEKKKKEAEDEEEAEKAEKEKIAGMDAALLKEEIKQLKDNATKVVLHEIAARDTLAKKISEHVGTFDHSDKTLDEVAKYGVEKLGLKCPAGSEKIALDGFFHNRQVSGKVFGLDSKTGGSKGNGSVSSVAAAAIVKRSGVI